MPRFYILSQREPSAWSRFWSVQTREFAPKLASGARLHFDLRANPVVTANRDGTRRRHDVVMQAKRDLLDKQGLRRWQDWHGEDKPPLYSLVREACGAWLRTRAPRIGVEIADDTLSADGYERHAEDRGRLVFSTVDFSGELTVVDPAAFCTALYNGIGPAKAFGCGLMLIRRP